MAEIKSHIGVHTIPLVSARKATVKKNIYMSLDPGNFLHGRSDQSCSK